MIGNHWWHETRRGDIIPPKAVISISGEPSPLESLTEWSTPLGKNFDVSDPPAPSTTTYMGRCIGKQLFITDYDDRKKKVEALVRVVQPADEQEGEPESCMGERVNTYRPSEDRQWNGHHGGDSSSGTPSPSLPGSPVQSPLSAGPNGVPDYFAMGGGSGASTPGMDYPGSSDGGRVRPSRAQKRSSLNLPATKGGSAKNRRRVNSASGSRDDEGGKKSTASSGALWSVNIGETAIWTVVGTDQVRYDFYIPPTLYNSAPSGYPLQSQSSALASSPSALGQSITPAPSVVKYLPPERAQELPKCPSNSRASSMKVDQGAASKMLTLYGENFNKGDPVSVWFGSEPSPHTEVRCTEVINCLPPPSGPLSHYPRPIVLVRNDGVVFPTKVMYP
ncbi:hypothetical protein FRC00_011339 [Tulasnella sp. 408]|nr:hypothetical protein FRC00_011339 [Tulasnella sp. 408]